MLHLKKKRHKVALLMLTTMVAGAQILNVLLNLDTQADMLYLVEKTTFPPKK